MRDRCGFKIPLYPIKESGMNQMFSVSTKQWKRYRSSAFPSLTFRARSDFYPEDGGGMFLQDTVPVRCHC